MVSIQGGRIFEVFLPRFSHLMMATALEAALHVTLHGVQALAFVLLFIVVAGGSLAGILEASKTSATLDLTYWLMPQLIFLFVIGCILVYLLASITATMRPPWADALGVSVQGDTRLEQLSISITPSFWILVGLTVKENTEEDVSYIGFKDVMTAISDPPTGATVYDMSVQNEAEGKTATAVIFTCVSEEVESLPMEDAWKPRNMLLSVKRCAKDEEGGSAELFDILCGFA